MAFRKGIIVQLGAIMAIVDIDNAVAAKESLKTVCLGTGVAHQPTALKQSLKCPDCGNDDAATFKKAQVVGKDQFIVVEKTEVADAKVNSVGATNKFISVQVHPAEEVHTNTVPTGSVYQLKAATAPMVPSLTLLWDSIVRHPEWAFTGLWSPAGRQNLYEVVPFGDSLIMRALARTEDLKIVPQPLAPIDPAYRKQVDALLSVAVVAYDQATYQDAYLAKLAEVLASKTAEAGVSATVTKSAPTAVGSLDLGAMLAAGLKAAGLQA